MSVRKKDAEAYAAGVDQAWGQPMSGKHILINIASRIIQWYQFKQQRIDKFFIWCHNSRDVAGWSTPLSNLQEWEVCWLVTFLEQLMRSGGGDCPTNPKISQFGNNRREEAFRESELVQSSIDERVYKIFKSGDITLRQPPRMQRIWCHKSRDIVEWEPPIIEIVLIFPKIDSFKDRRRRT